MKFAPAWEIARFSFEIQKLVQSFSARSDLLGRDPAPATGGSLHFRLHHSFIFQVPLWVENKVIFVQCSSVVHHPIHYMLLNVIPDKSAKKEEKRKERKKEKEEKEKERDEPVGL